MSVNLQRTKHHKKTDIAIHSHIDTVMRELCGRLGVVVPPYTKPTPVLYSSHTPTPASINISIEDPLAIMDNAKLNYENSNECSNKAPLADAAEISPKQEKIECEKVLEDACSNLKRRCSSPLEGEVEAKTNVKDIG